MSSLATIQTYIDSNLDIFPEEITAEIDILVRKKMLELDHNDHPNIQGGAAGERYHLTLDQYNSIAGLDLGTFVLKAGDVMDDNASLEFSNGVQNLKIDPIGIEVAWNISGSANGYGSFSPSALHFDDDTAEQVDLTKTGLSIQNATFTNSITADEIKFTHIASAKDHTLKAIEAALVVSSTLAEFQVIFPNLDENKKIIIGGATNKIKLTNTGDTQYADLTNDALALFTSSGNNSATVTATVVQMYDADNLNKNTLSSTSLELETLEGTSVISWLAGKKTLDISGTNLVGLSISKAGGSFVIGDWFSDTVPYQCLREKGGSDTDQWELYAQKGFFIRTNSLATTALIAGTQAGKIGIKNESPTYDLDVTGDLNVTGDYRQSGTVGYLASAWGAEVNPGLVLVNLRVRTLTINGTTVNVVVNP